MALENILSQEIVQKLGWTLLHFVWQAAAVTLILAVLLAVLRKSSANLRYIVACAALGLIVLLPIITMQLIPVSSPQPIAAIEPTPAPIIMPAQPNTEEIPLAGIVDYEKPMQLKSTDVAPMVSWKQRAVDRLEPALPYLVTGWLLGVFGLSLWHLGGWAQLQRLKKQMVKRVDVSLRIKLNELSVRLQVKQAVQLLESALVQVPTVVGWLRPVILLPASALTGLSSEQLEALLAHELAHIRRYDYLVNMLQTVVETLGFYHPAVWWVSHKIRVERENCCDDLAVSISGDRFRYAKALTSMEEIRAGRNELAVAASGGNLLSRIRRLIGKESNYNRQAGWIPSAITILLIAIIAMSAKLAISTPSKYQEPQQEADLMDNVNPESVEWENIGEIIPPDFNDTKVLTEHINLGYIGQDCEGKVFITCILDSAQSNVRQHRFVLVQKNGNILEPSGYTTFGPENKLQVKFSFNVPFRRQDIEGFRFQTRPLPLTGIDDSLPQLLVGNFTTIKQGKFMPYKLAPPGRYAIELDGIDDYLLVPDSPSLRLDAPFTVEMWIKTNLPADASKEYGDWVIISKGFYVGTPRAWVTGFGVVFQRYPEDPSKLLVDYVTANNSGTYSQTYGTRSVLTNGKSDWIHLYHVFDREKYKSAPGHPLVIGKYLIPTTRPLMGQIGEIRIWNSARTREQIHQLENVALTGSEPDLAAWWTFEQTEGQFAYDKSGNKNHARLGSSSGADNADPKWIDLQATPDQPDHKTTTQPNKVVEKAVESRDSHLNALPTGWNLDYDDGFLPNGGRHWPVNMANGLSSLELQLKAYDLHEIISKGEKYEFRIFSLEGEQMGDIRVISKAKFLMPSSKIFKPGKYALKYRREWGQSGDNFRMECGEYLIDLSKPGMYYLAFSPKVGKAEISGSLGGCYAINFEKIGDGPYIRGSAYQYPAKQYALDGLPPGKYRLSAVTMHGSPNVFVSQAEVAVEGEDDITVNIDPPRMGSCSLKGTIHGRHEMYKTPMPASSESEGRWFILIRKPGSGPIGRTDAYEALTMDSLYVIRSGSIVQQTQDNAQYHIEGVVPGQYTVTAIEHPWRGGLAITRQESKTLLLKDSEEAVLDFDLRASQIDKKTDAQHKAEVFGRFSQDERNVVGATVIARIRSDQPSKSSSITPAIFTNTDDNGLYRFTDLPAGRYSIAVMSQKGNLNIAQKQIKLEPGDRTELNFGDEDGFTLTGVVTVDGEAVEIASVMIQLPDESIKWGWTTRDGNYRITGIPSGRHEIVTTYDKDLDPVTFLWGKDGKQEYDTRFDRRQITIESDLSVDIHIGEQRTSDNLLAKSTAPSAVDKSIVRIDLAVVEVSSESKVDSKTTAELRNLLGGKITIPDSADVADLLRKASEATAAVKDESAVDKRVTQQQFDTLFDLLVSRGFVKILMRPTLQVMEGQTAQIKTDQNSLEVTVESVKDDHIAMQVKADLNSQIAPANEGNQPMISRRSFASFVRISSGQSQIIGGMIQPAASPDTDGTAKGSQTPARELMCIVSASIITPSGNATQPMETVNFQNAEAGIVIEKLAQWTGKMIIPPAELMKQKITIYSPEQMPRSEAAAMILNSLRSKGYTAEQTDDTIYLKPLPEEQHGTGKAKIQIEARIMTAGDEFLKEIGFDANSVPDMNAWPEPKPSGAWSSDNLETYNIVLNDSNVDFLLKTARAHKDTETLTAPRVTAWDRDTAEIAIAAELNYTSGYSEPNRPADEPKPKFDTARLGNFLKITPQLTPDKKNIIFIDFELEIRRLQSVEDHMYKGKYPYQIPHISVVTTKTQCLIPVGVTLLNCGRKITRERETTSTVPILGGLPVVGGLFRSSSKVEDTRTLLIMVKPSTDIKAPPTPQPIDPNDPLIKKLEEKFKRSDEKK